MSWFCPPLILFVKQNFKLKTTCFYGEAKYSNPIPENETNLMYILKFLSVKIFNFILEKEADPQGVIMAFTVENLAYPNGFLR
jgi:hypothetical protein